MTVQDALARIIEGRDLSRVEAAGVLQSIMTGESTASQIAGLLVALRMKRETVDEITGFAETMRALAAQSPVNRAARTCLKRWA